MTNSVDLLKQIVMLKPGGEVREQQHTAVSEIEESLQEKKNLLLEAPTGSGKALHIDTPILTTKGWSTMGELKEGDMIYGTNGKTTTVTKAHTPFLSEALYSLKFSNGEEILADSDHLWNVEPFGKTLDIRTTSAELNPARVEELKTKTLQINADGENTRLEDIEPVTLYPRDIVLAAFSYSEMVEEDSLTATADAFSFLENLYQELLGRESTWRTGDIAKAYSDDPMNNMLTFSIKRNEPVEFEDSTAKLPAPSRFFGEWLAGSDSVFNDKQIKSLEEDGIISSNMIPDAYFNASVAHREQLLLGIFNGEDEGEFHTTSQVLADDIQYLIATLGRTSVREDYFNEDKLVTMIKLNSYSDNSEKIAFIQRVASATVRCITVDADDHLFLAGKQLIPTHNTLSYLIPLVENETLAVVSTATKQLSEQIMGDIEFLNTSLKALNSPKRANASLLKGRDNYLCLAKFDEILRLEDKSNTLFSVGEAQNDLSDRANKMIAETKAMSDWANETESGDRTEAPPASDETWRQYSSTNAECPGRSACPFGQECFAELARDKAREANIVITNHAIVALDLDSEGQLLGDREVFVFDELHELDTYMSSAWGAELTYRKIDNVYKTLKTIPSLDEKMIEELKGLLDEYDKALRSIEKGLIDNDSSSMKLENFIIRLANTMTKITGNVTRKEKESGTDALKRIYTKAKKMSMELQTVAEVLSKTDLETVRWTTDTAERKKFEPKGKKALPKKGKATSALSDGGSTMTIHAAPLRIGPKLQNKLTGREATMIGLSATVTVMGRTDIPVHNFGLDEKPHKVVVLDTPFDYKKQAMLYIPDPKSFPIPVGATRQDHAEAMKADSAKLIAAAGGRALILSTTTGGITEYAEYYRKKLPKLEFLAQGDAPNSQLVADFKERETSCLIGTMGFWHGLDAPGKTLTLDIIDKIPFPTPDDPLLLARKNYADKLGRNGFMEIYVTIADWMLRQGFGRAIRSKSDRAVIAIYDTRLIHKNYGRAILQNFHGVGMYHDHDKVASALKRLVG